MTFSIYAFLPEDAPRMTTEHLAERLRLYFRNEDDFSITFERIPFADEDSLALWLGDWLMRVSLEHGSPVGDEAAGVLAILGSGAPTGLNEANVLIRVVFGSDPAQEYTNQIIYMLDYLKDISGAIVFDPQQGKLLT
jgi:hypothetical protein